MKADHGSYSEVLTVRKENNYHNDMTLRCCDAAEGLCFLHSHYVGEAMIQVAVPRSFCLDQRSLLLFRLCLLVSSTQV